MDLQRINEHAARIRAEHPIAGQIATNAECAARALAVWEAMTEMGLWAAHPDHRMRRASWAWYTVTTLHGVFGQWANSAAEAALGTAIWRGSEVVAAGDDIGTIGKAGAVALFYTTSPYVRRRGSDPGPSTPCRMRARSTAVAGPSLTAR